MHLTFCRFLKCSMFLIKASGVYVMMLIMICWLESICWWAWPLADLLHLCVSDNGCSSDICRPGQVCPRHLHQRIWYEFIWVYIRDEYTHKPRHACINKWTMHIYICISQKQYAGDVKLNLKQKQSHSSISFCLMYWYFQYCIDFSLCCWYMYQAFQEPIIRGLNIMWPVSHYRIAPPIRLSNRERFLSKRYKTWSRPTIYEANHNVTNMDLKQKVFKNRTKRQDCEPL